MVKKRSRSELSKLPAGRKLKKYKPGEHIGRPVGPGTSYKPKTPKVGPGGEAPRGRPRAKPRPKPRASSVRERYRRKLRQQQAAARKRRRLRTS